MTPDDEATFITLWQQGTSQQEMAQRLGVPLGTIKSRAFALARQGKITPRPRGGTYRRQRAQQRVELLPPSSRPATLCTPQCIRCIRCRPNSMHCTVQCSRPWRAQLTYESC